MKIPFIAITGSNGKTTTKELIQAVLIKQYNSFCTPGNLNNHIGVPLSLLQITNEHEIAVLEIGANHIGENEFLTNLILPSHGVTTNIGKDHLGEFGGLQGVIKAYQEFTDYFKNDSSKTFFLNADDHYLPELLKNIQTITYGISTDQTSIYAKLLFDSIYLKAIINHKSSFEITTQLFGNYNIYNVLAATLIGLHFNISIQNIQDAISNYKPTNNRSQIVPLGNNTIILDAYNANPSSMELVISDFDQFQHNHKIIVLGDMHELGTYSKNEHQYIINKLKESSFDKIILIGKVFGEFKNEIKCLHFDNSNNLKEWFRKEKFSNTCFLLKGSRSEKLELMFEDLL